MGNMIRRIVICDDCLDDVRRTKDTLEKYEKTIGETCDIKGYTSGRALLDALNTGEIVPDIIFMDIELQEESGINVTKEVNRIMPQVAVVYLSNYIQYAMDAYRTEHLYYVLKSELMNRLPEVYEKIERELQDEQKVVRMELKKNKFITIKSVDILFFERSGRTTIVHTKNGEHESPLTISELEEILDVDIFARCHNSYIVSMQSIKRYMREEIVLEDKTIIPISRKFQPIIRKKFMEFARYKLF